MKFLAGDPTDTALCHAIRHEFLRRHDSFEEFAFFAKNTIGKPPDRNASYLAYNAYARFLHHLYEFMLAAYCREQHDTKATSGRNSHQRTDRYIDFHVQRILTGRRTAIKNGTAPVWENALSAFPEHVPLGFGSGLREWRNSISGHVDAERTGKNLSVFYRDFHMFVHMLYRDAMYQWGPEPGEFPNLSEVTAFSVELEETPPQMKEP